MPQNYKKVCLVLYICYASKKKLTNDDARYHLAKVLLLRNLNALFFF